MARLHFTKENMPKTREEFQHALKEAIAKSNPVDDLLELAIGLHDYELEYGMTSVAFFEKYQRGEMGDAMPFIKWAGRYQIYIDLKNKLKATLKQRTNARQVETQSVTRLRDKRQMPKETNSTRRSKK